MKAGDLLNSNSTVDGVAAKVHMRNPRQSIIRKGDGYVAEEEVIVVLSDKDDIITLINDDTSSGLTTTKQTEAVMEDLYGLQESC